jgi:hypothetical protein
LAPCNGSWRAIVRRRCIQLVRVMPMPGQAGQLLLLLVQRGQSINGAYIFIRSQEQMVSTASYNRNLSSVYNQLQVIMDLVFGCYHSKCHGFCIGISTDNVSYTQIGSQVFGANAIFYFNTWLFLLLIQSRLQLSILKLKMVGTFGGGGSIQLY